MVDEIDRAVELELLENEAHIRVAARAATDIPTGESGVCNECDVYSPRLVHGRCAPCRDGM